MKNCQQGLVDSTCIPFRKSWGFANTHVFIEHFESINVSSMSFLQFCVWIFRLPFVLSSFLAHLGTLFHPTFLAHREHFTNDFHQQNFWPRAGSWIAGWVVPDVTLIISMRYINIENCLTMMCLVWDLMQLQVRSSVPTATWWIFFFVNNFFRCGCYGMEQVHISIWEIFSWSSGIVRTVLDVLGLFGVSRRFSVVQRCSTAPASGRLSLKLHPATWLNCGGWRS